MREDGIRKRTRTYAYVCVLRTDKILVCCCCDRLRSHGWGGPREPGTSIRSSRTGGYAVEGRRWAVKPWSVSSPAFDCCGRASRTFTGEGSPVPSSLEESSRRRPPEPTTRCQPRFSDEERAAERRRVLGFFSGPASGGVLVVSPSSHSRSHGQQGQNGVPEFHGVPPPPDPTQHDLLASGLTIILFNAFLFRVSDVPNRCC